MRVALVLLAGCLQGGQAHCNLVCTDNVTLSAHVSAVDLTGDRMTLCMNNACDFQMLPLSTFAASYATWAVDIAAVPAGGSDIHLQADSFAVPLVDGDVYRITITTPAQATVFDGSGSASYTTMPQLCGYPGTCTQGGVTLL